MKVQASSLRKGAVVDMDGKLYIGTSGGDFGFFMTADIPPTGKPPTRRVRSAFRRVYSVMVGSVMPTACGSGRTPSAGAGVNRALGAPDNGGAEKFGGRY